MGFLIWMNKNENEYTQLIYQLVFNFALAIFTQKVGVRCNDKRMIDAGRYTFLPMFYAFNHPIYQFIEYTDLQNRSSYPNDIKNIVENNLSFNKSNLPHNHQGGDFCLEEKIKKHKMVAPKGPVSNETWKKISRGLDEIEKICNKLVNNLRLATEEYYKEPNMYNEIVAWRALLRESMTLQKSEGEDAILNLYGEPLSMSLEDFTAATVEKMENYWANVIKTEGKPVKNNLYEYLQVQEDIDLNFDSDDSYDEDDE